MVNTQKIEIAINQLERVHRDMNDCTNRFILKDVINQLQEQVKLFAIPAVVLRSEQLPDDLGHDPILDGDDPHALGLRP